MADPITTKLSWRGHVLLAGTIPISRIFSISRETSNRCMWSWKLGLGDNANTLHAREDAAKAALESEATRMLGEMRR